MKKHVLLAMCMALTVSLSAQNSASNVLDKMNGLYDQFNKSYDADDVKDELVIVFVPGGDNPFGKVYDKHKGKKINTNVQFIGGFKEMMNNMSKDSKKSHLQDAFKARYGKDHFTILLDLDSDVQTVLGNKGYAIAIISKKKNALDSMEDFGSDRAAFFQALKEYMK